MAAMRRLAILCLALLLSSIGSAQQTPANGVTPGGDLPSQHRHHRDQRGVVCQLALAQQPDAGQDTAPAAPGATATARKEFATLADYSKATGQDQHSVTLDYDVFVNVPKLDRDPRTVQRLYEFKNFDFRLKPGAAAIDRGVALPNINDGFAGKAPDLGAFEAGQLLPIYGPRR